MSSDTFPVYMKNGAIINDVRDWVKLVLLFKKMRKRVNYAGVCEYYKCYKDIKVVYNVN